MSPAGGVAVAGVCVRAACLGTPFFLSGFPTARNCASEEKIFLAGAPNPALLE